MPLTAQLGVVDAKPINLELGRNAVIAAQASTTPATLVVEVAFGVDPVTNSGYYYNDLNDGPTGYWRMDSQTSLVDQTGSGNNMTVEGTPTLTTGLLSGDSNQATIFNGTSQDAYAPSATGLSPTGPMTLELWVKTPGSLPGSTVDIAGKRGSYRVQLTATGKLVFGVKNTTLNPSITSTSTLATSTTYHIAAVYTGSAIALYVNGVLDATTAYSGGIEATPSRLKVGGADNSSASPGYRSNSFRSDTATGIQANKPTGTVDGDYMITQLHLANFGGTVPNITSVPAGWTLIETVTGASSAMYAYGKVAAGEPASWSWGFGGGTTIKVSVSSYTGVSSVVPYGSASSATTASGTGVAVTLLPAYDNTLAVSLFAAMGAGVITWTESVGTERLEYALNSTSIAINTNPIAASSATTNTGTASSASELLAIQLELVGTLASTYTSITLDEVSLFGLALAATAVQQHYLQAVTPPPTVTWSDISADVREVQVARGRQYELNRIEAGTAALRLNDDLRKYDPANTSSPYAPNVIPMRQIRIRALLGGNYYPLFQGYIERWESQWDVAFGPSHAECQVTAVDGFEPLSLIAVAGTTQSALSGTMIASLLGAANWPAQARSLDTGAFTVAAITRDAATPILDYVQQVAEGESGYVFVDASGNFVFHDKNHRTTNTNSTVSQGLFGDQTLMSLPYTQLNPSKDKDHIVNDWTVTDAGGGSRQVTDPVSLKKFFHRTGTRATLLSAADADTIANYLLTLTAYPGYRFDALEAVPNTNLPLWLQALQREIGDRITVQRQPVGVTPGSQIVADCWIERVAWSWRTGQPARVTWQLSPAT